MRSRAAGGRKAAVLQHCAITDNSLCAEPFASSQVQPASWVGRAGALAGRGSACMLCRGLCVCVSPLCSGLELGTQVGHAGRHTDPETELLEEKCYLPPLS